MKDETINTSTIDLTTRDFANLGKAVVDGIINTLSSENVCRVKLNTIEPSHYNEGRKYTPISVIELANLGFCLGNVVKYISRAGRKGSYIEDLNKAHWYLLRRLEQAKPMDKRYKIPAIESVAIAIDWNLSLNLKYVLMYILVEQDLVNATLYLEKEIEKEELKNE